MVEEDGKEGKEREPVAAGEEYEEQEEMELGIAGHKGNYNDEADKNDVASKEEAVKEVVIPHEEPPLEHEISVQDATNEEREVDTRRENSKNPNVGDSGPRNFSGSPSEEVGDQTIVGPSQDKASLGFSFVPNNNSDEKNNARTNEEISESESLVDKGKARFSTEEVESEFQKGKRGRDKKTAGAGTQIPSLKRQWRLRPPSVENCASSKVSILRKGQAGGGCGDTQQLRVWDDESDAERSYGSTVRSEGELLGSKLRKRNKARKRMLNGK